MSRSAIIVPVILLWSTLNVSSQFVQSLGLKAGISLANQSYRIEDEIIDYTLATEPVMGPAAALFMEFYRGGRLGVQADLAYASRGCKTSTSSVTVNHLDNNSIIVNEGDLKVSKYQYISFTPMALFRMGKGVITPYALMGPRFDLLLEYETDSDYPLEDQNSFTFGFSGGAGVEFNLKNLGVLAELQYQPDLSPVTNKAPLMINNNSLVFTVGIRYLRAR